MNITVYSCLTGGKDVPQSQPQEEGVRYVLFTDQEIEAPGWEVIPTKFHKSNRRTARKYKVLSHKYFPEADYTIWIDANMKMEYSPSYYVKIYMDREFIACRPHPTWGCIYTEALKILQFKYEEPEIVKKWTEVLVKDDYPERRGLAETGFLVRKNCKMLNTFENYWWACIEDYSQRDQLSFDYSHWKLKTTYKLIDRKEVTWYPHKKGTTITQ